MDDARHAPDRRHFLRQTLLGAGVGSFLPGLMAITPGEKSALSTSSQEAQVVVFQGDSITDAGRSKDDQEPNKPHSLGNGYVALAAAQLLGEKPGVDWQCYNRGTSGHKVHELDARWEEDCLELRPDVLSILVGVNDFWHTLTAGYDGTVETYEQDYRALLDRTFEALPDLKLIIGEPFAVDGGSAIGEDWYPAFDDYRAAAQRVAEDYGAVWIPYQSIFDDALTKAPVSYWAEDGVHPEPPGNYLMAQAWLGALAEALE